MLGVGTLSGSESSDIEFRVLVTASSDSLVVVEMGDVVVIDGLNAGANDVTACAEGVGVFETEGFGVG